MKIYNRTLNSKGKRLEAYIFVDNLTLGPSLGGLRMKHYSSEDDVFFDGQRLAAGMTKKSALAGLPLGGGKAIIVGGPEDKSAQLFHEFGDFVNSVNGEYITAEDVGTGVRDLELVSETSPYVAGVSSDSGDPSPFTAYGVYSGMKTGVDSLEDLTVAVQGIGHVGFSLIFGFPLLDRKFDSYRKLFPGLINECQNLIFTDVDPNKLKDARRRATGDPKYPKHSILYHHAHAKHILSSRTSEIYLMSKDIFSPCALGAVIDNKTISMLAQSGCKVIAGAANNQLLRPGHGAELQRRGMLYVPDYVINAGGIINVWFGLDAKNNNKIYDIDASIKKCGEIGKTVKKIIRLSRAEKKPTFEIADILANEVIERAKH